MPDLCAAGIEASSALAAGPASASARLESFAAWASFDLPVPPLVWDEGAAAAAQPARTVTATFIRWQRLPRLPPPFIATAALPSVRDGRGPLLGRGGVRA